MVHRALVRTNQVYRGYSGTIRGRYKVVGLGVPSRGRTQSPLINEFYQEFYSEDGIAKGVLAEDWLAFGLSQELKSFLMRGPPRELNMAQFRNIPQILGIPSMI